MYLPGLGRAPHAPMLQRLSCRGAEEVIASPLGLAHARGAQRRDAGAWRSYSNTSSIKSTRTWI